MKAATTSIIADIFAAVFQSTPPVKAATGRLSVIRSRKAFQSTPPVKAATKSVTRMGYIGGISIHAAREGGDAILLLSRRRILHFNPRRP